jgi:hypothetical protein
VNKLYKCIYNNVVCGNGTIYIYLIKAKTKEMAKELIKEKLQNTIFGFRYRDYTIKIEELKQEEVINIFEFEITNYD